MEHRTLNTKRNIKTGLANSAVSILLPFLVRTAILRVLGNDYVGISSLFSSILQVLNMADLGFSTAIIYSMYKPVAENDTTKIKALLGYYRLVYRSVGCVILVSGLVIMPWLPKLVRNSWPSNVNLYFLYLIYLANTAVSYFLFAYKNALLTAMQRADVVNVIHIVSHALQYTIELIVVVAFKNIYLYASISILATVINNILVEILSKRKFPELYCDGTLGKEEKGDISKQVKGLFIGKISDVSRNSFDSIVLSVFFGLTTVGIYNNYYYIYNGLYALMIVISGALQASVGNSVVVCSTEKNYHDLRKFQFIYNWLCSWCTVCLFCLYQPFMRLWAGDELLLSDFNMALFCVYFYSINMNNCRNLYFSSNGLWAESKLTFVLEAVGNLLLNLVLGKLLGISGILIATIITILVFNYICRTNILFSSYFKISPKQFYIDQLKYTAVTIVATIVTFVATLPIKAAGIGGLAGRALLCTIVPNIVFLLCYVKNDLFKQAKSFISAIKLK